MSDLLVGPEKILRCAAGSFDVVIGRGGFIADKREGDGGTPIGRWPLRRVLYRPDRIAPPRTGLAVRPILPDDLWCDAPDHPAYNRPVRRPFAASAEDLWRADHVYDVVVIIGHNDDPVTPGLGSAIFMHLQRPDRQPTAGCIALTPDHMTEVLKILGPGDALEVRA